MSKKGRRKKQAYQGRKKEFCNMMKALVLFVVALFFCVDAITEAYPTYNDLQEYTGVYRELEARRYGRRSRAYGLVFEDGSDFYIHPDFKKQDFQLAVSPGDELHILAADIRRPISLHGDLESVVFELFTAEGLQLRDYDSAIRYLEEMRTNRIMIWGLVSLVFVAMAVLSFWDWKRCKAQCARFEEQKST